MKHFNNAQIIQIFNFLKNFLTRLSYNLYFRYFFSLFLIMASLSFVLDTVIESLLLYNVDFGFQIMQSALLEGEKPQPALYPQGKGMYWRAPRYTEDGIFIDPGGFKASLNMYPVAAGLLIGMGTVVTISVGVTAYYVCLWLLGSGTK